MDPYALYSYPAFPQSASLPDPESFQYQNIQLHAPQALLPQSSLLYSQEIHHHHPQFDAQPQFEGQDMVSMYHPCDVGHPSVIDIPAPPIHTSTFPTPSELMAELQVASGTRPLIPLTGPSAMTATILQAGPPNDNCTPVPTEHYHHAIGNAAAAIDSSGHQCLAASSDVVHTEAEAAETARKARRRAMAKSVGFVPTDP